MYHVIKLYAQQKFSSEHAADLSESEYSKGLLSIIIVNGGNFCPYILYHMTFNNDLYVLLNLRLYCDVEGTSHFPIVLKEGKEPNAYNLLDSLHYVCL